MRISFRFPPFLPNKRINYDIPEIISNILKHLKHLKHFNYFVWLTLKLSQPIFNHKKVSLFRVFTPSCEVLSTVECTIVIQSVLPVQYNIKRENTYASAAMHQWLGSVKYLYTFYRFSPNPFFHFAQPPQHWMYIRGGGVFSSLKIRWHCQKFLGPAKIVRNL